MSILDDIFNTETEGDIASTMPGDVLRASVAMATHQLMESGFDYKNVNISNNIFPNSLLNQKTTAGINPILTIQSNYLQVFLAQKLRSIPFIPNADYAVNGGIKRGAKISIEVVDESSQASFSQLSRVRQEITGTNTSINIDRLYFDKFSVMNIMESTEMRYNMHESFGADFINSLGRRPRMITLSGSVLNGRVDVVFKNQIVSMDWKNALQRFFDNDASLHQNAIKGKKLRIFAQDTIYEGYAVNLVANTTAMDQGMSSVTMTIILKNKSYIQSNDGAIPGKSTESVEIDGLNFPEPDFSLYMTQDYAFALQKIEAEALLRIKNLTSRIIKITKDENGNKIKNNVKNIEENDQYFYPSTNLRLHKLLSDSVLYDEIIEFSKDEAKNKNTVDIDQNYYYYESVRNGYMNRSVNANILCAELFNEYKYLSDIQALIDE